MTTYGSVPMPDGDPLLEEEVDQLAEGTPVVVIWTGGNGPHQYVLHVCDRDPGTRYVWDGQNERLRHYNPLRFVGTERYNTRVWRAER
jgi:hypothetical protein